MTDEQLIRRIINRLDMVGSFALHYTPIPEKVIITDILNAADHVRTQAREHNEASRLRSAIWVMLETPGASSEETIYALRGFLRLTEKQ